MVFFFKFFLPHLLTATLRSSNLIGPFTSLRTNHRHHLDLDNNVTVCHMEFFLDYYNLEHGTDKLTRKVCKQLKTTLLSIP